MTPIARVLKSSKNLYGKMESRRAFTNLLLESFWIDNLTKNKINSLIRSGVPIEEIIILDYLFKFSAPKSFDIVVQRPTHLDTLVELLLNSEINSQKCSQNPSSPIKQMAEHAFMSLLTDAYSRSLLEEKLASKDDCKLVLFFDYIYKRLSRNRQKIVRTQSSTLISHLERCASIYVIQQGSKVIRTINNEIEEFVSHIEKTDGITPSDIKKYQDISNGGLLKIETGLDTEIDDLIERKRTLLERAKYAIDHKIFDEYEKLKSKQATIEAELFAIEKKELIGKEDINALNRFIPSLEQTAEFYSVIGYSSDQTKCMNMIISIRFMLDKKDVYDENIKRIRSDKKRLSNSINSLYSCLANGNYTDCNKYLSAIEKVREDNACFIRNMYLRPNIEENLFLVNQFYETVKVKVNEKILALQDSVRKKRDTLNSLGFFKRMFIKTRLESEIEHTNQELQLLTEYLEVFAPVNITI